MASKNSKTRTSKRNKHKHPTIEELDARDPMESVLNWTTKKVEIRESRYFRHKMRKLQKQKDQEIQSAEDLLQRLDKWLNK